MPLAVGIGRVYTAASKARGNKTEAKALARRAQECGGKMSEVIGALEGLPISRAETVSRTLEHLAMDLEECAEFLGLFAKKGFLSKMMSGKVDARKFEAFDRRLVARSAEVCACECCCCVLLLPIPVDMQTHVCMFSFSLSTPNPD